MRVTQKRQARGLPSTLKPAIVVILQRTRAARAAIDAGIKTLWSNLSRYVVVPPAGLEPAASDLEGRRSVR